MQQSDGTSDGLAYTQGEAPAVDALFNHPVGAQEQSLGNREAQRFGSFQVDHKLGLRGLLHHLVTMLDTGSPTRQGSGEARAIATKYGLEFLPA